MSNYPDNYDAVANYMEAPLSPADAWAQFDAARANLADARTAGEIVKELRDFASLLRGFDMNDPDRTLTDGGWTLEQVIEQIEAMVGGAG